MDGESKRRGGSWFQFDIESNWSARAGNKNKSVSAGLEKYTETEKNGDTITEIHNTHNQQHKYYKI